MLVPTDLETLDTLITAGIATSRADAVRRALARIRERPAREQLRARAREIEESPVPDRPAVAAVKAPAVCALRHPADDVRPGYHVAVIALEDLQAALRAWPYRVESVTPLAGGWNSTTWLVVTGKGRYVAKLVDDVDAPGLVSGLRVAEFLARRGLACGVPARTCAGDLTISLAAGTLALLRHQPGTPPDLSVPDQVRRAGRVLALAHQALRDFAAGSDRRYRWPWEWVAECLDTIDMPQHVTAAARRTWGEVVRTVADHQLSVSVIHADPGPGGFLLGGDGAQDAIIDWATTLRGPLLYDLACFAVITTPAGPQVARWFTEGYLAQQPEIGPQLAYLDCLVKARWLANAIYFSSRIQRGITRGSDSPTANQDGLAAAYAGMTAGV